MRQLGFDLHEVARRTAETISLEHFLVSPDTRMDGQTPRARLDLDSRTVDGWARALFHDIWNLRRLDWLARAGARRGVPVTVYVSASATPGKMAAIRALGATLVIVDGSPIEAELQARHQAEADGIPYISPYNDADVVAGQGTLGVELAEQAPGLDAVFIAVGGGGLVSGAGTALKALSPQTRIVGAWAENSPCMLRALERGEIVDVAEAPTLSDGTAGAVEPGSLTFPLCQAVIDETVAVSERSIAAAMRLVAEHERWVVEGAAGVALAGLAARAEAFRGGSVAVVLCGRNISLDTFLSAIGDLET